MKQNRKLLLKSYIDRLTQGESLESVREEFVENFKTVEASEIARAEQELIEAGVPIEDVQRLCDVHSALFHGKTTQEQMVNADMEAEKDGQTALELRKISGHPIQVFMDENDILELQIKNIEELAKGGDPDKLQEELRVLRLNLGAHYSRKADLIYPLLDRTYKFSGPSNVMWGVDGDIRNDMGSIVGLGRKLPNFEEVLDKALTRAVEMIYKENNILLPLCAEKFSEEDWMRIYLELSDYENFLEEGPGMGSSRRKRRIKGYW